MEKIRLAKISGEIMMVQGDDGKFHEYDPTWDLTIHCKNEEDMRFSSEAIERGLKYYKEFKDGVLIRPRKAGWIEQGRIFSCSRCDWNSYAPTNYCPNCGSSMTLGEDE